MAPLTPRGALALADHRAGKQTEGARFPRQVVVAVGGGTGNVKVRTGDPSGSWAPGQQPRTPVS